MSRRLSDTTRRRISRAMRGKRNAAGPHRVSRAGRRAIAAGQRRRWRLFRAERDPNRCEGTARCLLTAGHDGRCEFE